MVPYGIFFIYLDLTLYHYWNSTDDKFDFNNMSQVISSNNATIGSYLSPSKQTYTIMTFGQLFPLFMTFCIFYGLLLTLLKHCVSTDFKYLSHAEQFRQVMKQLIIPEVQWVCLSSQWKLEMLLLVIMQIVSNLILLVPFFVTGKNISSKKQKLGFDDQKSPIKLL